MFPATNPGHTPNSNVVNKGNKGALSTAKQKPNNFIFLFLWSTLKFLFIFGGSGVWIQGSEFTRGTLHYLSHTPNPI
jgi:hypothetical protein